MKKRDLTKLALMGIAMGLCGGQIQADDLNDIAMEDMYVANTGCGAPSNYPSQPVNSSYPSQGQAQPQLMQQGGQQIQQQPQPQQGGLQGQRPMGQGKQMTTQGGYLVSEAPPMPEDHPASDKGKVPPPAQKMNPQQQQSNNGRNQGRPTADSNNSNYYQNSSNPNMQQRPYPNQNPNSTNR